ncbi:hypothetical protein GCM10027168_06440 [Streptomyces capparidis]
MLREVVPDDRVLVGLVLTHSNDSPGGSANDENGSRADAKLLFSHREGLASWVVRPSIGIATPGRGPRVFWCSDEREPALPERPFASRVKPIHPTE